MLWKVRVIGFYGLMALVSLFFYFFICVPVFVIKTSLKFRYKISVVYSYIFIYSMRWICGVKFCLEGLDLIPKKIPFLILPNHQSHWENFFMHLILPQNSWVIKREFFEVPIFGSGLKITEPIAIDRTSSMSVRQIIEEGRKKLENNISMVIFPEGTRVKVGRNIKLKPSAAKLAIEAKVPIVIIVHNSGNHWPKGFWILKPGTITLKVIEVLSVEKIESFVDARELTNYIQEVIHREKNLLPSNS